MNTRPDEIRDPGFGYVPVARVGPHEVADQENATVRGRD